MKAMIFAAGRGNRMRPLTDTCPKPLLKVRGRPLIVWHIVNLVRAGITEIVINHAHLGEQIEEMLGDGSRYGAAISYSHEESALETAGGIAKARHLLGEDPFVTIAADVYCPYFDFEEVKTVLQDNDVWGKPYDLAARDVAWLYLVPNPPFHPHGDFALNSFTVKNEGEPKWTYSGIGVFRMSMFDSVQAGEKMQLGTLLREYISRGLVGGEIYRGEWKNVNTIEELDRLNAIANKKPD